MLTRQFQLLDSLLHQHRWLWQFQPFHVRGFPDAWPDALCQWLSGLDAGALGYWEQQPDALLQQLSQWFPALGQLTAACAVPALHTPLAAQDAFAASHIPGRKWAQICHFAGALPGPAPLLEWCAGKGHLGRLLARSGQGQVTSLEWQTGLCQQGQALARGLPQQFVCADALGATAGQLAAQSPAAVALHACGELHLSLLRHWQAAPGHWLALSPCCYHLSHSAAPLSRAGRAAAVSLQAADLGLPLRHQVTGGARIRRLRERQQLWRLAFDEWQRQARAVDDYLPLPSVRDSQLAGSFTAFMQWAAGRKGLALPPGFDPAHGLAQGQRRVLQVRRLELVAHVFRRPLELWLVLDRALFLQDKGARVQVQTFCEYALTPRNLLITAEA